MSPEPRTGTTLDDRGLQFAGAVLLVVGLHFVVEAALGRVHAVPGTSPASRLYGLAAAGLFLAVGAALVRRGHLADRRLEWATAALSLAVLALVSFGHLL